MTQQDPEIAFGPIPSRRLGQSLGINNIPYKICTYSCVYCQVGLTNQMVDQRAIFYPPEVVVHDVNHHVKTVLLNKKTIDYLSFVPDGEPTLDINLGIEIDQLRPLKIPIAVITNSSLLYDKGVRRDLCKADWVSLKLDAATPAIWKQINRPQKTLDFKAIIDGMITFSKEYRGILTTETMLVNSLNDSWEHLQTLIEILKKIEQTTCYLSVPIRPPAVEGISPSSEHTITMAYNLFKEAELPVELNTGYRDGTFGYQDDIQKSLLRILNVHPMNESEIQTMLDNAKRDWTVIEELQKEGKIIKVDYQNKTFYTKKHTR
jgi:wyosine [tRNA(Phe)-imidazoG37] synthetase (radical SAM superfamily)